jgi:hypothetical protein
MDVCQVAANGACLHPFPTLVALHIAGVPFGSCDPAALHPGMRLGRKLGPNPTWYADHCVRFGGVGPPSYPLKQVG